MQSKRNNAGNTDVAQVVVYALVAIIIIVVCLWIRGCWRDFTGPQPPPPITGVNYSIQLCDGPRGKPEHHENEIVQKIDIPLGEGCYSGFVSLPRRWGPYQFQLRGTDKSDWMAFWCGGNPIPYGPYSYEQINAYTPFRCNGDLRLEGKGVTRFFAMVPVE
jgi:hypothetical protein